MTTDYEDHQQYEAFVSFLRTLLTSTDVAVVSAAGTLLQDLGEEPSE